MACPDEAELSGFLRRDLAATRSSELEAHFDRCADCRQLVFALAIDGSQPSAAPSAPTDTGDDALAEGARLGRFQITGPLARGAMGVIYRAHDPTLRRDVALKLLHVEQHTALAADAQTRMLREAQGLARLEHPNVVTVFDAGLHGDQVFIAMELIEGATLERWLAERPRPWRQIAAVLERAGRGLAAAHAAGLVHRDVKPANVMIAGDGRVKVVDFGLVRGIAAHDPSHGAPALDGAALDLQLTLTGALVGTPAYCAPEQLSGGEVDPRSDLFSFCVTLCEAIHGRRPYVADSALGLLRRMRDPRGPDLPGEPRLPRRLRALIRRGLAFDRAERLPLDALLDALAAEPARRRSQLALGAAAGVAAAAVGATLAITSPDDPCTGARDELAAIWNPTRRTAVHNAILRTGVPYAADTWDRVERTLDGYADRWAAMHLDTCRATAVHRTQSPELLDRRMACLAERRTELDAAIGSLGAIDATSIREALRIASGIPSLAACADAKSLLAVEPLPVELPARVPLEVVRVELAQASALHRAGAYARALALARHAATTAQGLGYRPLEAEALHLRGTVESAMNEGNARESFERAVWAAAASGHARLEARALADLAVAVHGRSADGGIARAHAQHALAIAERTGKDPMLEAAVHYASAHVLAGTDFPGVQRHVEQGLRRLDEAGAVDPTGAAMLRIELERMLATAEQFAGSGPARLRAALAHAEQVYGANHPALAELLGLLASSAIDAGQLDEARGYADRVTRLLAGYPGHDATRLHLDAMLERDAAKRLPILERWLASTEARHGRDSPQVAEVLDELASALLEVGRERDAAPQIDRSVAIWQHTYGGRHESMIVALTTQAQVYMALGELETAVAAAERAMEIAEHADLRSIAQTLAGMLLADAYFQQQRYARSLELFERYTGLVRLLLGDDPNIAIIEFMIAACHWELGRDRPAMLRRARELHRTFRAHQTTPDRSARASLDVMESWLARRR
ncbi:MAG: protein kinase domain-containing protein [Kofleriaceae bacterium]